VTLALFVVGDATVASQLLAHLVRPDAVDRPHNVIHSLLPEPDNVRARVRHLKHQAERAQYVTSSGTAGSMIQTGAPTVSKTCRTRMAD